jgi:hypothetical protein
MESEKPIPAAFMLAALIIAVAVWVTIGPPPQDRPTTPTNQLTSPL